MHDFDDVDDFLRLRDDPDVPLPHSIGTHEDLLGMVAGLDELGGAESVPSIDFFRGFLASDAEHRAEMDALKAQHVTEMDELKLQLDELKLKLDAAIAAGANMGRSSSPVESCDDDADMPPDVESPPDDDELLQREARLLRGENVDNVIEVFKRHPKLGFDDDTFMAMVVNEKSDQFVPELRAELESRCDLDPLRALLTISRKQSHGRKEKQWDPSMMKKTATTRLFLSDGRVKPKFEAVDNALVDFRKRACRPSSHHARNLASSQPHRRGGAGKSCHKRGSSVFRV